MKKLNYKEGFTSRKKVPQAQVRICEYELFKQISVLRSQAQVYTCARNF